MGCLGITTTIYNFRVKQKATDSPKAAEKEYSEKLNRMSRY